MAQVKGVVHFSIPVTDPARSRQFYCEHLGMKVVFEAPEMVFLDAGGDCIVLVKVDGPISTAGVRNVHHAFLVEHAEYRSAVDELRRAGINVLYEEDRNDGVIDGPRAYFRDPDGNTLELIDLRFYGGSRLAA